MNTEPTKLYEIRVPFAGFYGTQHSDAFDQEIENVLEDYPNLDYIDVIQDWEGFMNAYSEAYVDAFVEALKELTPSVNISLKYLQTDSPKEYNFTNDLITALISEEDIHKLMDYHLAEGGYSVLGKLIEDKFTNRDGFVSFYSNKLVDWKTYKVMEWDDIQLSMILEAAIPDYNEEVYVEIANEIACDYVAGPDYVYDYIGGTV